MKTWIVIFLAVFLLTAGNAATNTTDTNRSGRIGGRIPSIVRIKIKKKKNVTAVTNRAAEKTDGK